jgi:hypothetical protein
MLKESTQKRLLQMAGLGQYEEEVLTEMKSLIKKEKLLKESNSMKKDEDEKKAKKEDKTKEYKKLSEKPFGGELEEGPTGEDAELGLDDGPEDGLDSEPPMDVEGESDATVDFDSFATDLADLLAKHGGGAYAITKDGQPLTPVSEDSFGPTDDFGSDEEMPSDDLGGEEMPSDDLGGDDFGGEDDSELPPPNPQMRESKSKDVARMVFESVIAKLNKKYATKEQPKPKAQKKK